MPSIEVLIEIGLCPCRPILGLLLGRRFPLIRTFTEKLTPFGKKRAQRVSDRLPPFAIIELSPETSLSCFRLIKRVS